MHIRHFPTLWVEININHYFCRPRKYYKSIKDMKKFTNSVVAMMAKMAIVAALVFALPVLNSCSSSDDTKQENTKIGSGYTSTTSSELSCSGASQSMSFSFSTEAAYTLEVEGGDWLTFAIGATGSKAGQHTAKANIAANPNEQMRSVDIYITVEGYNRTKIYTVKQTAVVKADAVVDWIDDRLSSEYYWLDEYNEMVDNGEVDYSLAYDKFLSTHLLAMRTNMDDGYVDYQGKRKLYSNIQRYNTTRADETRASKIKGLGILLCPMVWMLSDGPMPTYGFAVEHVYPGSPAEFAGLERGDIIAQVNGSDLTSTNYSSVWTNIVYSAYENVSLSKFVWDDALQSWTYSDLTLSAGEYYENPVAYCGVLEEDRESGFVFGDKKIGYIAYLSFDANFDEELINSLKVLKAQNVTDVIVDLRTNGGGSVLSASYFGSMLTSADKAGKNIVVLERNKSNANGTTKVPFVNEAKVNNNTIELPHLDLPQVYVITTSSTASASEMLVMGLRAQGVKVYTIGETSNGKNCGMDVMIRNYGSYTYEFAPITFMAKYDNYEVDYADGIVPNIKFADLIQHFDEDSYLYYALSIFPIPDMGMTWGNYGYDIAVSEAVARIIGGTIFTDAKGNPVIDDIGPGMKAIQSPLAKSVTRSSAAPRLKKSGLKINVPAQGMRFTEQDHITVREAQGLE